MNRRVSRLGGGSDIPSWGPLDPGRDRASMIPGSNAPGSLGGRPSIPAGGAVGTGLDGGGWTMPGFSVSGAGNDTNTNEPAVSALSAELEAELREEAEEVFRELVGIGLTPFYARNEANTSVWKFVRDFKPGGPIAEKGKRLNRDIGPWNGRRLPDRGFQRMREQNIRAGRYPLYGWSTRSWGPRSNSDGSNRPMTRGQCQAVDNINGEDSHMVEGHDRRIAEGPGVITSSGLRGVLVERNNARGPRFGSVWDNSPEPEWARRMGWSKLL